jgi:uncharacterized protein (DUF697 family)
VTPYGDHYAHAKELVEQPEKLFAELDRVLGAAAVEVGPRLEETVRLAEMALVARLSAWRLGPPQPAIRQAVAKVGTSIHDPLALGLGLRLAAGYARLGRVDDEAHRLAALARRVSGTGLGHPDQTYADEAERYLDEGMFLPTPGYTYEVTKELSAEQVFEAASAQLARSNPGFAVQLAELHLVRELDPWYMGPSLPNVERALRRYREERPGELLELGALLARAYVKGGFVDLRAREHVLATLEGEEAQMVGPEAAIALREYVDRDCFDYPDAHVYAQAKQLDPAAFQDEVRTHMREDGLNAAQRLCEMRLVRRYAPWLFGDPDSNVRSAIQRFVADTGEDASWVGRFLAGIYVATLQGEPHARQLVHHVVSTSPEAPELLEAIRAAGIPGDVSVTELHQLYLDVVEIEARVEAFRAGAEARGGLSDYEREAYTEVLAFLEREETSRLSEVSRALGELVEAAAPDALLRTITSSIEDALRLSISGTNRLLRRDRILRELARRDPALRSLERIRDADLTVLDEVAWSITRENRVAAALEGLGCGLGGPTLLLVDLPMLVLVNLNAVAAIATVYGFDVDDEAERELIVAVAAGGRDAVRQLVALQAESTVDEELRGVVHRHLAGNAALAAHAAAARMAARLARQKLVQLVPILGGAVGAGINFHFTHTTSRTAVMTYRLRWLMRRFGEPEV